MNYENFEDFWKENQKDYIEFAKKLLNKISMFWKILKNLNLFVLLVSIVMMIFLLLIKLLILKFLVTQKEILKNTIDFLMNLQLESFRNPQPYNLHKWEWLRDETIGKIKKWRNIHLFWWQLGAVPDYRVSLQL